MKTTLFNIFFLLTCFLAKAQNNLTLQQAIQMGIANSIDVNQSDLLSQKADLNWKQSKADMLPNLNASASQGINEGRTNNPITNAFINQNVNYGSYGATSSVLLFNGSSLQNSIKANSLGFQASKMELQQAKDNLTINIILAYLNVLSAEDILESSKLQSIVTQKQVERTDILNQAGAIPPSQYYDLKGQLANDELTVADNVAAVETAKLNLGQLLNILYDKNMEVERLPEDAFNINYDATPENIYATALQKFAQIKAVHLRTESEEKLIRSLRGQLYPTLYLNGSLGTNYSSAATQSLFLNSVEVPSTDYVIVNGTQFPVITKQDNYNTQKISYNNQLSNNYSTNINLGLTIQLFNAFQVRTKVKLAKIDLKNSELVEQNTKTLLQQSIERAYVNLTNTSDKYKILQDQQNSFAESFHAAEIKFNSGAITSVDYLIAKNNLDKTNTNLIISKYDFVLRAKILDYYQGKTLW
jgi:outer membrane protein